MGRICTVSVLNTFTGIRCDGPGKNAQERKGESCSYSPMQVHDLLPYVPTFGNLHKYIS